MELELTIPENLSEITVKQYKKFLVVCENIEGEFYNQRMVEILCNTSFANARMMSRRDVLSIVTGLNKLFDEKKEFNRRFELNGTDYGMIPKLDDMSSGEYSDLTGYITSWPTMHQAMAVLFRPVILTYKEKDKEHYTISEYEGTEKTADFMDEMPLDIAMGAMVFFYTLISDLLNSIQTSTAKEVAKEIIASLSYSGKNGVGIKTSTHSLMESLETLTRLPSIQLDHALCI